MMMLEKGKRLLKQNWLYYITGFFIILVIKFFYSRAGSNELDWILAPTAEWVRILTGTVFERVPQVGYVSNSLRFIIAPSCSGVQFLMIAAAAFIFSFVHCMETRKKAFGWIAFSLFLSYSGTILVNGLRITISIYLPMYLHEAGAFRGWLTPERVHTIIGVTVYMTSLLLMYRIAEVICGKISSAPMMCTKLLAGDGSPGIWRRQFRELLPPLFWYFFIVLGLPVLNRAYRDDYIKFFEYALLIAAVCLPILCVFTVLSVMKNLAEGRKSRGLMPSEDPE